MATIDIVQPSSPVETGLAFVVPGPVLSAARASKLVGEVLSSAEETAKSEVLLDLSSVSRMSTGALALLLLLQEHLAGLGSRLSLVPPIGQARALIRLYKLEGKFGLE